MELSPQRLRRVVLVLWVSAAVVLGVNLVLVCLALRPAAAPPPFTPASAALRSSDANALAPLSTSAVAGLPDYAAIWQRQVSTDFSPPPPAKPQTPAPPPEAAKLALKALLWDRQKPLAVLAGEDQKPLVLAAGAARGRLRLLEVHQRAVLVEFDGQPLRLELPQARSPAKLQEVPLLTSGLRRPRDADAGAREDSTRLVKLAPAARAEFLESLRFDAIWAGAGDTRLAGLRITSVKENSACAAAGIRGSDILHAVSGRPIADLADLARLYDLVLSRKAVEIELRREGETYRLLIPAQP